MEDINPNISIHGLEQFFEGKKDLVVAELGVLAGKSTIAILIRYDVKKYYAVDMWEMYEGYHDPIWHIEKHLHESQNDLVYKKFKERIKDYPQVVVIREMTSQAHKHIKDGELDICWIDANHEYKYVYEDIKLWISKVKKGGVLCGDDYRSVPDVAKAVHDFFRGTKHKINVSGPGGNSWWVII